MGHVYKIVNPGIIDFSNKQSFVQEMFSWYFKLEFKTLKDFLEDIVFVLFADIFEGKQEVHFFTTL